MKRKLKNIILTLLFLSFGALYLSSCYETRYNNQYHHHTRPWYDHHHMRPPEGVNFDRDVYRH
jgi:hypothetical protein